MNNENEVNTIGMRRKQESQTYFRKGLTKSYTTKFLTRPFSGERTETVKEEIETK